VAIEAANSGSIAKAAGILRAGGIVAFPTETVYGLGGDANNGLAVAAIYAVKGRPAFNPLIAHVATQGVAEELGQFNVTARRLAAAFWPGPLTLVVQKHAGCPVSELATVGLTTIALRIPAHPVALDLLRAVGRPIVAPSANRSGHVSSTTATHVQDDLGDRVAMVLDGGATAIGVESTVIDCAQEPAVILRPGGITREAIEAIIGRVATVMGDGARPSSPGQLESHYAPKALMRLGATTCHAGEALLAFGPRAPMHDGVTINLSPSGDLSEAAANLFAALRTLDANGVRVIAVTPIPEVGLGIAINDRLRRAAAPRP
jgi:L-threonylcarbamoyladenylate synthase